MFFSADETGDAIAPSVEAKYVEDGDHLGWKLNDFVPYLGASKGLLLVPKGERSSTS